MPRRIGIVTSDPIIASAIYDKVLEKTSVTRIQEHLDVALYSRMLIERNPIVDILEGTEVMRKMNMSSVIFPELDIVKIVDEYGSKNIPNQSSISASPKLQAITSKMINEIRENIATNTEPTEKGKKSRFNEVIKLITEWADFLKNEAIDKEDVVFLAKNKNMPDTAMLKNIKDPSRYVGGLIAIHGGMGPEAGNSSFKYLGMHYNSALLLMSDATTPNAAARIVELLDAGLDNTVAAMNHLPRMLDTRRKLASIKPDVLVMTCNTVHFDYDKLALYTDVRSVHLVEEGIKKVPKNSKALILATEATIKSHLHETAANKLGRRDIEIIIPDKEHQQLISEAIWNDLILGNKERGQEKLKKVADHYINELGEKGVFIAGCTEIILGLKGIGIDERIIDNAVEACKKCAEVAKNSAEDRLKNNPNSWKSSYLTKKTSADNTMHL